MAVNYKKEYHAILKACSDNGISDTSDVALSDLVRGALSQLRALAGRPEPPRMFPIQNGPDIPWSVIAPFDKQCQQNHGRQTLERLAERGGLSMCEALAVLHAADYDEYWKHGLPTKEVQTLRLTALVTERLRVGRPEPPLHAITCPQNSLARESAKLPNVWGDDRCNCGAAETFLAKHLADEVNEAHQQLDKLGAPKTKMVPKRSGGRPEGSRAIDPNDDPKTEGAGDRRESAHRPDTERGDPAERASTGREAMTRDGAVAVGSIAVLSLHRCKICGRAGYSGLTPFIRAG